MGIRYTTPLLKIGQPLTKEVQDESAEAGEFITTATGEGVGTVVEFIVAYFQKGRFASDDDNRSYAANGTDTIPEHWSDFVGEEFVGTSFSEHPDAEEQYKKRVNAKEIPWGSGPPIKTTYVFTGIALVEDPDTQEVVLEPVRLSLKSSDIPAANKWLTLIKSKLRNKPWWGKTFILSTTKNEYKKGAAFNIGVKLGRDTTAEERELAQSISQAVVDGRVADNAESESAGDKPAEPKAREGALEV